VDPVQRGMTGSMIRDGWLPPLWTNIRGARLHLQSLAQTTGDDDLQPIPGGNDNARVPDADGQLHRLVEWHRSNGPRCFGAAVTSSKRAVSIGQRPQPSRTSWRYGSKRPSDSNCPRVSCTTTT